MAWKCGNTLSFKLPWPLLKPCSKQWADGFFTRIPKTWWSPFLIWNSNSSQTVQNLPKIRRPSPQRGHNLLRTGSFGLEPICSENYGRHFWKWPVGQQQLQIWATMTSSRALMHQKTQKNAEVCNFPKTSWTFRWSSAAFSSPRTCSDTNCWRWETHAHRQEKERERERETRRRWRCYL